MAVNPFDKPVSYVPQPLGLERFAKPLMLKQQKFDTALAALDEAQYDIQGLGATDTARAKELKDQLDVSVSSLSEQLLGTKDYRGASRQLAKLNKFYKSDEEIQNIKGNYASFQAADKEYRARIGKPGYTQKDYNEWRTRKLGEFEAAGGTGEVGDFKTVNVQGRVANQEEKMRKEAMDLLNATEEQILEKLGDYKGLGVMGKAQAVDTIKKWKKHGQLAGEIYRMLSTSNAYKNWLDESADYQYYFQSQNDPEFASKQYGKYMADLDTRIQDIKKNDKLTAEEKKKKITDITDQKEKLAQGYSNSKEEFIKGLERSNYAQNYIGNLAGASADIGDYLRVEYDRSAILTDQAAIDRAKKVEDLDDLKNDQYFDPLTDIKNRPVTVAPLQDAFADYAAMDTTLATLEQKKLNAQEALKDKSLPSVEQEYYYKEMISAQNESYVLREKQKDIVKHGLQIADNITKTLPDDSETKKMLANFVQSGNPKAILRMVESDWMKDNYYETTAAGQGDNPRQRGNRGAWTIEGEDSQETLGLLENFVNAELDGLKGHSVEIRLGNAPGKQDDKEYTIALITQQAKKQGVDISNLDFKMGSNGNLYAVPDDLTKLHADHTKFATEYTAAYNDYYNNSAHSAPRSIITPGQKKTSEQTRSLESYTQTTNPANLVFHKLDENGRYVKITGRERDAYLHNVNQSDYELNAYFTPDGKTEMYEMTLSPDAVAKNSKNVAARMLSGNFPEPRIVVSTAATFDIGEEQLNNTVGVLQNAILSGDRVKEQKALRNLENNTKLTDPYYFEVSKGISGLTKGETTTIDVGGGDMVKVFRGDDHKYSMELIDKDGNVVTRPIKDIEGNVISEESQRDVNNSGVIIGNLWSLYLSNTILANITK